MDFEEKLRKGVQLERFLEPNGLPAHEVSCRKNYRGLLLVNAAMLKSSSLHALIRYLTMISLTKNATSRTFC